MTEEPSTQQDEVSLKLAQVWLRRNKPEHAIPRLRELITHNPGIADVHVLLGSALLRQERYGEAEAVFAQGLARDPNLPELHKGYIESMVVQAGIHAAFHRYQLERVDDRPIDSEPAAVHCCVVARNEALRLPFFLNYYRQLGVHRFFFVDNGSTDDTMEFLLGQPDVHLWRSPMSFNQANFGSAWFELLLRRYGRGRWWVMADADELLVYADVERASLPALCRQLNNAGKRALTAILIDMYSDHPIARTDYHVGEDFRVICPYFDRQIFHRKYERAGPYHNMTIYEGGARERVFGSKGGWFQVKTPLLRYDTDCILSGGQHLTNLPATLIADAQAAVLHFKYFSSFPEHARQEARRGEHHAGAHDYHEYVHKLTDESLTLFHPEHSIRLENSAQLEQLGVLRRGEIAALAEEELFPHIPPVAGSPHRPFWSVMITVFGRSDFLEQSLLSVLNQAPSASDMEIMVVSDGGVSPEQQQSIAACIEHVGRDRVHLHQLAQNAGHPHIFNICVALATGEWVHILHDDDVVAPGFYAALAAGAAEPDAAAAFCRCRIVDEQGSEVSLTPLEQEQAGVLRDWLERIASFCRIQTPAMMVRRAAYERLGGYSPAAGSAFDWEMWQRLAAYFTVWYEPRVLATFRRHAQAVSAPLMRSGQQVLDARKSVEIAQLYLPHDRRDRLAHAARANYARYALKTAQQFAAVGDPAACLANLQAAMRCSQAEDVMNELGFLLSSRLNTIHDAFSAESNPG
jgi:hypothetical protein